MAVPDFQAIMLPLLRSTADGEDHTFADAVARLESEFGLTPDERAELLPSGRYPRFRQRVGWAKTYLSKAGLLDSTKRGVLRITDAGKRVLSSSPSNIDIKFLQQFPAFIEFQKKTRTAAGPAGDPQASSVTPRESLETAYQQLRETLATELLERVKANSPAFFERLVVELLVKMGYGGDLTDAGQVTGGATDRGIDGVIQQDVLGLERVYIQAKRYADAKVRSEIVRNFAGSLLQAKASKGVLITTSDFSEEAKLAARSMDLSIVLIDGERMADLMVDFGVGVIEDQTFVVKRIDSDYFDS